MTKKSFKSKTYLLVIKDKTGMVKDVIPHPDYNILLIEGMEQAKEIEGRWEIYNIQGKYIDGSR